MAKKDTIVIAWGRFNPPTTGHEVVILRVEKEARARNADYLIYPTKSMDRKKNPLTFKQKVRFMKRMFPKHSKNISTDASVNTLIKAAQKSEDQGYSNLVVVVGADRIQEFKNLLDKYNGRDYNFDSIDIVSAGERDPDAEDITGMSASKMRAAAADGDYDSFKNGLPRGYKGGKELFDAVRGGMGIKEDYEYVAEDLRSGGIGGPRFNRLLRFGLAVEGPADIPLTKRAFNNFKKSQSDPKMREKVYQTTDKLFDFVIEDDIIFHRFLMLLNRDKIYGDSDMTNEAKKIISKLKEKSEKSGISYDTLSEVYLRGIESWESGECLSEMNAQQWSFSRVNSFIAGGRARKMLDDDLLVESCDTSLDDDFDKFISEADYQGRLSPAKIANRRRRLAQKTQAVRMRAADKIRQMRQKAQDREDRQRKSRSVV